VTGSKIILYRVTGGYYEVWTVENLPTLEDMIGILVSMRDLSS